MRYLNLDDLIKTKQKRWGKKENLWEGNANLHKDFRDYFHGKCWYCECTLAGSDMHIEHFRPKGRVDKYLSYNYNEDIEKTGYNWLKDDPKNYRCSCTYSNSLRSEGGKGNYFPLTKSSGYMKKGSFDTSVEQPMLLDPCNESDVKLLTFIAGIPCCTTTDKEDNERVKVSSALYNLEDAEIKRLRINVWNKTISAIKDFEDGEMSKKRCIKELLELTSRESAYSGAAVAAVKSWFNDENGDCEEIKKALDLDL